MGAPSEAERATMKRIVCDTGPLLHLREADVRDLLSRAGEVHTLPWTCIVVGEEWFQERVKKLDLFTLAPFIFNGLHCG